MLGRFVFLAWILGASAVAACSTSNGDAPSSSSGTASSSGTTSSSSSASSTSSSSGGADAEADAADANVACEGACKITALTATFNGKSATLDRAQHGFSKTDVGETFHVEAHKGGDPACPMMNSPTPNHTLIVTSIPKTAAPGTVLTEANNVRATFLDFTNTLLPSTGEPIARATSVKVTVVAVDTASPPKFVAFDLDATYPNAGSVKGHVYTQYCTSLDE